MWIELVATFTATHLANASEDDQNICCAQILKEKIADRGKEEILNLSVREISPCIVNMDTQLI